MGEMRPKRCEGVGITCFGVSCSGSAQTSSCGLQCCAAAASPWVGAAGKCIGASVRSSSLSSSAKLPAHSSRCVR